MAEIRTFAEEKEYLEKLIAEWNASRLDIFAISQPTEDLEYRGVMRFFFQDSGSKVATKCVRVSSKDNTDDVTQILVEKFHPDMKMLTNPSYSLYEVHPNGEATKLKAPDHPLRIQLEWQLDDREGRFLLKSDQDKIVHPKNFFEGEQNQNLKRRLSKREKKQMKKKREEEAKKNNINKPGKDDTAIAQNLYNELPETSFTRSISNPEAVMRRRRQQKLEKKLKEFESRESGPGGTLKIFAETLKPEIPYKTLLVSVDETTTNIVKEALIKYNMEKEDPEEYCLVMVNIPPDGSNTSATIGKERVVHDEDCPLRIAVTWPESRGSVVFHLRRRANVSKYRRDKRRSKSPTRSPMDMSPDKSVAERLANSNYPEHLLPYLEEVSSDGRDLDNRPKIHRLQMNVTDVGSEKLMSSGGNHLQLSAPHILPRHCVITNMDGRVSITPSNGDAEVFVDGKRIYETTTLQHGDSVKIGRQHTFRFCDPAYEQKNKRHSAPNSGETGSISSSSETEQGRGRQSRPRSSGPTMQNRYDNRMEDTVDVDTSGHAGMFETTFDIDGDIKTVSGPEFSDTDPHLHYTYDRPPAPGSPPASPSLASDKLPATLEFLESGEDAFFAAVISEVNGLAVHFKLAPTYTLYMCSRYRMSPAYRPGLMPQQKGERLGVTIMKIANMARSTIRENSHMAGSLAFWMANCSELLHFIKEDMDISLYTKDSQTVLAKSVQLAFRHLVLCVQHELRNSLPAFLDHTDDADMEDSDMESSMNDSDNDHMGDGRSFRVHDRFGQDGRPLPNGDSWLGRRRYGRATVSEVIYHLSSTMSLLRRCRVNAALTIQVFSQLFHFVNMWLFNKLVLEPKLGLCSKDWGRKLSKRLARIEVWAQKQGLELAADCHLGRIQQAAHLLRSPKATQGDINAISSVCFKLNSVQMRTILESYRASHDEYIPKELIERMVAIAEDTADQTAYSSGQEIQLEEDSELQLPFLLPEDGYSCEVIRGVPQGLKEFLEPLAATGLCKLTIQPAVSGLWTVYQKKHKEMGVDVQGAQYPEIMNITFNKGRGGMGLSIVAAKGAGQDKLGIYIKQVVKDGPAARDGRLQAGDQLLAVNGESLVGVTQEKAAECMVKSGADVTLRIVKQGAIYHGLATLLGQQTPLANQNVPRKLTPLEPDHDSIPISPTLPEEDLQRSPTRWLPETRKAEEHPPRRESWRYEEEERRRREEEERRIREEEEYRRREEEKRKRREEEDRLIREQEERYRREEEERRKEAENRKRREEEDRRKREEEQKRREEEARRRREEEDEERKRHEARLREEERVEREEEAKRNREEQEKQARDEERRRREFEEDERLRKREEEIRRRMEEERRVIEEERRKLAEERKRLEEERRRDEERRIGGRRYEEERNRGEAQRFGEDDRRRAEEERRIEEEKRKVDEQRREDARRRAEEDRDREEQRRREEEERRYAEEEERRLEDERYEQEQRRREELRLLEEEEEELSFEEERRLAIQRRIAEERERAENSTSPLQYPPRKRKIRFEDEVLQEQQSTEESSPVEEAPFPLFAKSRMEDSSDEPAFVKGIMTEDQKSSIDAIFAELEKEVDVEPQPQPRERPGDLSLNQEAREEPSSPIRIDSRETPFGRAIVIKQSVLQQPRSPVSPSSPNRQENFEYTSRNLKDNDHQERTRAPLSQEEEFQRWEKRQKELAEQREQRGREEQEYREREQRQREQREREQREREQREREQREGEQREREQREREQREREQREREQREREQREREQREREQREREQREKREREQREREEREREKLEERERELREKHEREQREQRELEQREREERQRIERERADREQRERQERENAERERIKREAAERAERDREEHEIIARARRERLEREYRERIEREVKDKEMRERYLREKEEHEKEIERQRAKLLEDEKRRLEEEEEKNKLQEYEKSRLQVLSSHPRSRDTLDYIEAMSAEEVELEFKRRLEKEKRRRAFDDFVDERRASGLVSVARVTYHQDPDVVDKQEMRDRKLQRLMQETSRIEQEREELQRRRRLSEEAEERERQDRHQHRLQMLEKEREQALEAQRRLQSIHEQAQGDWLKQQKERREKLRIDQKEGVRQEHKQQEEEETTRKKLELQQKKEGEESVRQSFQRQREDEEKRIAEEQRKERSEKDRMIQKKVEEQAILREKEQEARRQLTEEQRLRAGRLHSGEPDHVLELKERALADYERRRKLIDQEIERRRDEGRALDLRHERELEESKRRMEQHQQQHPKPVVSSIKITPGQKPKKQVSFSNVATEIHEPSSPSYVVGSSTGGYTARVTPTASVRLVNTRPPDEIPEPVRPPPPVDDMDDLPPPPPPPPDDDSFNDDSLPPPPPPKEKDLQRFAYMNDRSSSSSSMSSRVSFSSTSSDPRSPMSPAGGGHGEVFRSNGVPTSGYSTFPRTGRPASYPTPADLDDIQIPDSMKFGGSNDGLPITISSIRHTQSLGRLGANNEPSVEYNRVRLARVSLTDEEKEIGTKKVPPPVAKKPENLAFRDKMKMFNYENTPQSKVRSSKWQRENLALNGEVTPP